MKEVENLLSDNEVKYSGTEFSVKLPQEIQEQKIADLIKLGYKASFVRFTKGTVVPEGSTQKGAPEHMYSFDYAYKLKNIREWLFKQKKN